MALLPSLLSSHLSNSTTCSAGAAGGKARPALHVHPDSRCTEKTNPADKFHTGVTWQMTGWGPRDQSGVEDPAGGGRQRSEG